MANEQTQTNHYDWFEVACTYFFKTGQNVLGNMASYVGLRHFEVKWLPGDWFAGKANSTNTPEKVIPFFKEQINDELLAADNPERAMAHKVAPSQYAIDTSNPTLARKMLSDHNQYSRRAVANIINPLIGYGEFAANDADRKKITPVYHVFFEAGMTQLTPNMASLAQDAIKKLQQNYSIGECCGEFGMQVTLAAMAKNVGLGVIKSTAEKLIPIAKSVSSEFAIANTGKWSMPYYLRKLAYPNAKHTDADAFRHDIQQQLNAALSGEYSTDPDGFVSKLKNAVNSDVDGDLLGAISEGYDAIKSSLSMCLRMLCLEKKWQDKLIDTLFNRPDEFDDELARFIKEVLRLYPPFWSFIRYVENNVTFKAGDKNVEVLAGDFVIISLITMQRDPEIWVDPNIFRPDRFKKLTDLQKEAYMPFCIGKQACKAQPVSVEQMKILIKEILLKYQLELVASEDDKHTHYYNQMKTSLNNDDLYGMAANEISHKPSFDAKLKLAEHGLTLTETNTCEKVHEDGLCL